MKALTDQHQGIEALTRQVAGALDSEDIAEAASATAKLGALFDRHGRAEEQGLLRQLLLAGEAVEEVERLLSEHEKFRAGLFDPTVVSRPDELRLLLRALLDHAELEETDLFPYAWQVLSGESWDLVEEATLGYSD
jgi:hemerythrin-like domain-containing protein